MQITLGCGGPDLCTSMKHPGSDSCLNTPVHPNVVYSQQISAAREGNHGRVRLPILRTVLWVPLLCVFSTIELACVYSKQMEVQSSLGNVPWSWN